MTPKLAEMQNTVMDEKDDIFGGQERSHCPIVLPYLQSILYFKTSNCGNFALFFRFSDGFFSIFFVATVGSSIELGAFDKITRSIESHVRFDFRHRDNSALNLEMLLD